MKTIIIDYGSGNVESVLNALNLVKEEGHEIVISKDPLEIKKADRLILPGVGSFGDCMEGLKSTKGLIEELKNQILIEKKPFLGVCVGMQVLASVGFEEGEHDGLNVIPGSVNKITITGDLKVPHMGWNDLVVSDNNHPVFKGLASGDHLYFANSYHFECEDAANALAYAHYGSNISAIVIKDNIIGLQFHPEKSGEKGLQILRNFLNY